MSPSNKKRSKTKPVAPTPSSSLAQPLHTATTTTTPIAAIPSDMHPTTTFFEPPSSTTINFTTFIGLADLSDIQRFCEAAASTHEGANLMLFWKRAFEEGRKVGYKEGSQMLEGVSVSGLFDQGQMLGIKNERREWETAGHGEACFAKLPSKSEAGTQVNLAPTPPPRIDAAIQTTTDIDPSQSITALSVDLHKFDVGTQVELADDPVISPHLDASIQTTVSPLSLSQPEKTSAPHLDWAEDAGLLPIVASSPPPLPSPPRQPRDLSVLRSSSPLPFSSLQRRSKRYSSRRSCQSYRRPDIPHSDSPYPPFRAHRTRTSSFFNTYKRPSHYTPPKLDPYLNWESDPRLSDLSRALKSLGWIRAS